MYEFDNEIKRTARMKLEARDRVYTELLKYLKRGNTDGVLYTISANNELAKSFTDAHLYEISLEFQNCKLTNNPLYEVFIKNMLFQNNDSGMFINRLPFVMTASPQVKRYFMPYKLGTSDYGYVCFPDCIDEDIITGAQQGVRLKNHRGRQKLVYPLPYDMCYEILTIPENVDYYKKMCPTSRVYVYSDLQAYKKWSK